MAKRPALEALDAMEDVASPAPKRQKSQGPGEDGTNGLGSGKKKADVDAVEAVEEVDVEEEDDNDADANEAVAAAVPIRQEAPSAGYSDLYLDTIDRNVLDFDFEKLCSVSLSNINVYACLVCGRYYQGRGPRSHAYFHALDEDHHVFINMQTQRVYVLPEGYEVRSRSLDDIKFVADPRYMRADVAVLDRPGLSSAATTHLTLAGRPYTPGFVGMNNIKENDYLNVVVQALAHVAPLRNFFLLDEEASERGGKTAGGEAAAANRELVRRFGLLVRKIWNPRAFKAHVSPHELLQEVALRSSKRFTLTAQSDPADFFTWFLNHLHLGLGGSRSRPGSSIVQRVFQGRVRVASEMLAAVGARAAAAAAADIDTDAMQIDASPAVLSPSLPQPPPPATISPFSASAAVSTSPFSIPPPPGVTSSLPMGSSRPPPPTLGPPGLSAPGVSSASSSLLPPPPPSASSLPPPPPSSSSAAAPPNAQASTPVDPLAPPQPTTEVSRFLLLTLDLPPAPLFQDEQERNIIPQVPLATLLAKYDGQSTREQGDVRRRFRLQAPLPPYLVLHMKRFSANKFVAERNPTIVTFDPQGLNMRPYVDGESGDDGEEPILYDLVANIVHEAVRTGGGDDVAVDSAEERRTWKVQLRDRGGGEAAAAAEGGGHKDRWVVVQDLFVEPVAGELLYLAESYMQIWERRRVPGSKGKGKKAQVNGR